MYLPSTRLPYHQFTIHTTFCNSNSSDAYHEKKYEFNAAFSTNEETKKKKIKERVG